MPRVSVVVPVYNMAPHIAETLDAVFAQEHDDLELIVVDDGSTDGTCEAVARYGDRLRLVRQANAGVCAARNHGLRLCTGAFVCFLDHDDVWFPGKLALQLSVFERDEGLGVVFDQYRFWYPDQAGNHPSAHLLWPTDATAETDPEFTGWIYHQLLLDCWILTSAAMIRREALQACGGFDETLSFSEDWDLWLRLSRHYRMAKIRAALTLYRQLPTQGSRKFRSTDHRTELLERAVRRWGYASPDGHSVDLQAFRRCMCRYHREHGLSCLAAGRVRQGRRSLLNAWRYDRLNVKVLLTLAASGLGWAPKLEAL